MEIDNLLETQTDQVYLFDCVENMLRKRNVCVDNIHKACNKNDIMQMMQNIYGFDMTDNVCDFCSLMNSVWLLLQGDICVFFITSIVKPTIHQYNQTSNIFITSSTSSISFQLPVAQIVRSKSIYQHYKFTDLARNQRYKTKVCEYILNILQEWGASGNRMPSQMLFITDKQFPKNPIDLIIDQLILLKIQFDFLTVNQILSLQIIHKQQPFEYHVISNEELNQCRSIQSNKSKLKKIFYHDPSIRYIGAQIDDVVAITDYHQQHGFFQDYRLVVENQDD